MKIVVVGGGTRCMNWMVAIERHKFQEISPKIVAVADLNNKAPGVLKAKEMGLFVTKDYNDFFDRDDIDLIVELTGNFDIYNDILLKKKKTVSAVDHKTAFLFREFFFTSNTRTQTKQKLQDTSAMYDVVLNELIQEDVMVIDRTYRIIDANDNLLKKMSLDRSEVIGRYCYEITHHQDEPCSGREHQCPLVQTIERRKPSQATHIHLDKEGKELFYSISCYPVFENGEVIGAIEISRDITQDINVQRIMMQQEKMVSIGRLSAGVAHEINNPLTTILTSAMLMQEDIDQDDPIYQELETIANETLRCRKIVTSLLDFARQATPAKKFNNINDIISECIVLTRKQAIFNDVTIEHDISTVLPPVNVDKDQIQQALINLTLNAIEATDHGGSVTFSTNYISEIEHVEIIVEDSGAGILSEDMDKIFDPFFTTKENGTGLGLAIIHGIIEQHGGTIDCKSEHGRGTTFTIRLPVSQGSDDVG